MSLAPNRIAPAPEPIRLTPAQRETAERVSEWFMPPVDGFPTVAEADPDGAVLQMALEQLRPLIAEVLAALDEAGDEGVAAYLDRAERAGDPRFELLRTLALGRYLSSRPVWRVLGYTGRRPIPIRPGEAEEYLAGDLLEPSRVRGKIYRPTPGV